jgi:pimeloyl-ACP methyl ester carboxylesterase
MTVQPFEINISQATIDDLQDRLSATRWTDQADEAGWSYGTNLDYLKELADYWEHEYDWREQEAKLNAFNWFKADIDGEEIRFIYERGKGPNPTPIVLLHGWPDSILRYTKLIPLLTDPASYGGDPKDSFDVIVPDLMDSSEGGKVRVREHLLNQNAERVWKLMTRELGYERFVASGGDGGSPIAQLLAVNHPDSMIGIHLTDIGFGATMAQYSDLSEVEQQYLGELNKIGFQEGAYSMVQGTKPQTLAYSLNDSPVGLASWIIEKFRSWSDCDGDLEKLYTKDELLTNIMLYWVKGFDPRGYREEWVSPSLKSDQQVDVPVGLAQPPKDLNPITPCEFAQRNLKNIQHWTVLPHGGHFAAMEYPEPFAEDLRAFVRQLRAQ